jgi:Tfp pilus assembly protein PilO
MIPRRRIDLSWLIGGAFAAVLVIAVGWFLAIAPEKAERADLNDQAAQSQGQADTLRHRLTKLQAENINLQHYKDQLVTDRQALPTAPELANFLRSLQTSDDHAGVLIESLTVGTPLENTLDAMRISAYPMTLSVKGDPIRLGTFLDQLQRGQPRAVLITGASLSLPADGSPAILNLTMSAFVAPLAAVATSPPATK